MIGGNWKESPQTDMNEQYKLIIMLIFLEYGKLVHLLMDSVSADVRQMLEFSCVKPVLTVHAQLQSLGALAMLREPDIETATMDILPRNKDRPTIESEIKAKERAIERLARKYARANCSKDQVRYDLISPLVCLFLRHLKCHLCLQTLPVQHCGQQLLPQRKSPSSGSHDWLS